MVWWRGDSPWAWIKQKGINLEGDLVLGMSYTYYRYYRALEEKRRRTHLATILAKATQIASSAQPMVLQMELPLLNGDLKKADYKSAAAGEYLEDWDGYEQQSEAKL